MLEKLFSKRLIQVKGRRRAQTHSHYKPVSLGGSDADLNGRPWREVLKEARLWVRFLFSQIFNGPDKNSIAKYSVLDLMTSPSAWNLDLADSLCATKINKLASRSAGLSGGEQQVAYTCRERGKGVSLLHVAQTGNATVKINKWIHGAAGPAWLVPGLRPLALWPHGVCGACVAV